MRTVLREHQETALGMLRESFRERLTRPVVAMPTGSGKTLLAASLIEQAMSKGKWQRTLFVVPRIDLVEQTAQAFWREGIVDVGCIQGRDHPRTKPDAKVQVCSLQTIALREMPEADALVIDECHLIFKWLSDWMKGHDKPVIGLSATPWSRGLGKLYNNLLVPTTTRGLIDKGLLSPFRVYAPSHPDLSGVKVTAGDYQERQLSAVMQTGTLVADAVETWEEHGSPGKTILFAVDRAHAKMLEGHFHELGHSVGYVDGTTPKDKREVIKAQFHDGEIKVLANVDVLTLGVDWDCRCIIYCRPTRSEIRHVQAIGRGLRTAEGKDELLIIDHSDTHLKLGFVDQIGEEWTELDDGRPRPKAEPKSVDKLPKPCPKCGVLMAVGMGCLACGTEPRQPMVCHVPGQLTLLERGHGRKTAKFDRQDKQQWWSQLLWIVRDRGYKHGWASHKYREKFGVWPVGLNGTPQRPTPEVYAWIKQQQRIRARMSA